MSVENVYQIFYRIPRMGARELSDGGGPFGFDITTALEFDYLIERYQCDAVIETGCNAGDTTHYLALAYSNLTIVTCDIMDKYVDYVRRRLFRAPNVIVEKGDSPDVIERYRNQFRCPLFFLDAHWYEDWPLEREIELIENGVVCIDDFDIGHERFGFDEYNGLRCGPEIMKRHRDRVGNYFYTNNPDATYTLPCLQVGRRSGKGYYQVGRGIDHFKHCRYFKRRETPK